MKQTLFSKYFLFYFIRDKNKVKLKKFFSHPNRLSCAPLVVCNNLHFGDCLVRHNFYISYPRFSFSILLQNLQAFYKGFLVFQWSQPTWSLFGHLVCLHGLFERLLDSPNLVSTARSWMPCSSRLSLSLLCRPSGPPGSPRVLWSCKRARGIVRVWCTVGTQDSQETGFSFKACFCCLHA